MEDGFIDLTREELEKLGNERVNMIDGKVVEFKADPDVHYIGGIGAFHQIHCLASPLSKIKRTDLPIY